MKRVCTIVLSSAALVLGSPAYAQDAAKPEAKPEARGGCHGMHGKHHQRHGKQEKHDHS